MTARAVQERAASSALGCLELGKREQPAAALGAWFLGPKAENKELLLRLIDKTIEGHASDRQEYFPNDPVWLTEQRRRQPAYINAVTHLEGRVEELLEGLKSSVPFFSYRYQGHMLWDVSLPAVVGYFAAMLYNQNNVAAEASPVTTWLEMQVGDDLSKMLGYYVPERDPETREYRNVDPGKTVSWGHITCDGSVANMEALWAARNLKYLPLGLAAALEMEPALAAARAILVTLPNGQSRPLVELSCWELLNLDIDEVLALEDRIENACKSEADVAELLASYSVQEWGISAFQRRFGQAMLEPWLLVPATAHYSWPKGAALLGIGKANTVSVQVDLDARLDIAALRTLLDDCLREQRPIAMVVAVLGTTEESAIDPLKELVEVRAEYRRRGLTFWLHVDAAWGGYFASMLRSPEPGVTDACAAEELGETMSLFATGEIGAYPTEPFDAASIERGFASCENGGADASVCLEEQEVLYGPRLVMSPYAREQYLALPAVDSITIDPHKGGYIPYPAGGLCYRNSAARHLVAFTAPVVYHGGVDPTVGVYGIEGSKPGASAAAVYLSHRVIPANNAGYGRILGRCLWNSKRLYCALQSIAAEEDPFIVVPLQRLACEREDNVDESKRAAELSLIRRISTMTNAALLTELARSPSLLSWFSQLGSDQVILTYAFNIRMEDGQLNTDPNLLNLLTSEIFRCLSLARPVEKIPDIPLFVTSSSFTEKVYGKEFLANYKRRLGVDAASGESIEFLISTTMDPWLTDTAEGDFVPTIVKTLKETVLAARQVVLAKA